MIDEAAPFLELLLRFSNVTLSEKTSIGLNKLLVHLILTFFFDELLGLDESSLVVLNLIIIQFRNSSLEEMFYEFVK